MTTRCGRSWWAPPTPKSSSASAPRATFWSKCARMWFLMWFRCLCMCFLCVFCERCNRTRNRHPRRRRSGGLATFWSKWPTSFFFRVRFNVITCVFNLFWSVYVFSVLLCVYVFNMLLCVYVCVVTCVVTDPKMVAPAPHTHSHERFCLSSLVEHAEPHLRFTHIHTQIHTHAFRPLHTLTWTLLFVLPLINIITGSAFLTVSRTRWTRLHRTQKHTPV
jgi:hypothetical protein